MKPSKPPQPTSTTEAAVEALFLRLGTIYGSHWFDRWRDAPPELVKAEWSRGLARFSTHTIRRALDWCAENQKYPPSLPDFVAACREALPRPESHRLLEAPHEPFDYVEARARLAEVVAHMRAPTRR